MNKDKMELNNGKFLCRICFDLLDTELELDAHEMSHIKELENIISIIKSSQNLESNDKKISNMMCNRCGTIFKGDGHNLYNIKNDIVPICPNCSSNLKTTKRGETSSVKIKRTPNLNSEQKNEII